MARGSAVPVACRIRHAAASALAAALAIVLFLGAVRYFATSTNTNPPIEADDPIYAAVYRVFDQLAARNASTTAFLDFGSVLGALRHNGTQLGSTWPACAHRRIPPPPPPPTRPGRSPSPGCPIAPIGALGVLYSGTTSIANRLMLLSATRRIKITVVGATQAPIRRVNINSGRPVFEFTRHASFCAPSPTFPPRPHAPLQA